jgi:acyl-CoA thioesterase FadM
VKTEKFLLPRNAFSPRETARAGDLWRACQDTATAASIDAGWPPSRYVSEGNAFIVRTMTTRHERETSYGEAIVGESWVSRVRREMFMTREVRLVGAAGLVLAATQEWVHVSRELKPSRAPETMLSAFPVADGDESVVLSEVAEAFERQLPDFTFLCWETWMDPLGHVNHPQYVDFCDEALSRAMRARGVDPVRLVPKAEQCTYRAAIGAGAEVRVTTRLKGFSADGAAVFGHELFADGALATTATTVRTLLGDRGGELAAVASS